MATEITQTPTEYIAHHLVNWHAGHGFWTFHVDTLLVSGVIGLMVFGAMALAARKATPGVPGGFQNFVEMVVSLVNDQVKDTFHAKSNLVTPLAITIFVWVFLMNAMDLIPVDFIPQAVHAAGGEHFKAVPTTDPNLTFAMSITVFFIMLAFNFKYKGIRGFLHEALTVPFGKWLFPLNLLFRIIEDIAKPISLALRLFGNMYAGEMVFILLAVWAGAGWLWVPFSSALSLGWALFHILIITLQAFVFMMLTVVYMSMAAESH
ncbi:MAG TPA: F0F1 ATP synthase subunit A [Burkholderiales bacterium]|nr:F0F1 ATP synthase subunit A [Burkholderiales bacterium]